MGTERMTVQDDPQARALLQGAAAQSYKLPLGFAGFRADLAIQIDNQSWLGHVIGYTPRHVSVTLADADARLWAEQEVQSILGHRWPTPFQERDGRYTLTLGDEQHPLGIRIDLHGDPLQSYYRVHEHAITQVHRVMGDQNFTIQILDTHTLPDNRHLPKHFIVVFREHATGRLLRNDTYTDTYALVKDCWLPALRRVIVIDPDGMRAYVMKLENHRLLDNERENHGYGIAGHPMTDME